MANGQENLDNLIINAGPLSAELRAVLTKDGGDITITRALDGSPTLQFNIMLDKQRTFFKSGLASQRFRASFHGFDFEVAQVRKSKNRVSITMEDLAVAELRRHKDPYVAKKGTISRVDFVRQLLKAETPQINLYVDPSVKEPTAAIQLKRGTILRSHASGGVADPNFFTDGGGSSATGQAGTYQVNTILTAEQIGGAAKAAGFSGNGLVMAIAIALAESGGNPNASPTNSGGSAPGSQDLGLWQINNHFHADLLGQYVWSDPLSNAKMAYIISSGGTNWNPWSTYGNGAYKQYLAKAQAAAGNVSGDYATVNRGAVESSASNEDSWTCFKRIFNEVNWRLYADHGNLYAGPDSAFIDKTPIVTLREFEGGVNFIDYDYDTGKPASTVTIDCLADSWVAVPGSVMELPDTGLPITKWLCSSVKRSLFSRVTTIVGTSPLPELPEPIDTSGTGDLPVDAGNPVGPGATGSGGASNGMYIWPVTSRKITAPFGETRPGHIHAGIDIACNQGSTVVASAAGVVLQADNSNPTGYGNAVYINHENGDQTRYGHLSSFTCRAGMSVKQGQQIALSGGTPGTPGAGDATGPHLHFEIRQGGQPTDPIPLLSNAAPPDAATTSLNIFSGHKTTTPTGPVQPAVAPPGMTIW